MSRKARSRESDYSRTGYHLEVRLDQVGMRRVAQVMKDRRFYLETITAVDFIDYFELVYFYSTYYQDFCRLKTGVKIPKDGYPLFRLCHLSRGYLVGTRGL